MFINMNNKFFITIVYIKLIPIRDIFEVAISHLKEISNSLQLGVRILESNFKIVLQYYDTHTDI